MNRKIIIYSCVGLLVLVLIIIASTFKPGNRSNISQINNEPKTESKTSIHNSVPVSNIIPKLYLESSGSMWPYATKQGQGIFQKSIFDVLNGFGSVNISSRFIYIVNNSINPLNKSFSEFVQTPIFYPSNRIGDATYTDFDKIFRTILTNTNNNQLSILISDLTYSTRNLAGLNNIQVANQINSITQNVFNSYASTHSIIIVKLEADYQGAYYPYCHPTCKAISYNGNRPYYICFIGRNEVIKEFIINDKYSPISNYSKLQGYKFSHIFYRYNNSFVPFFSVLLYDRYNSSTIRATKDALRSGVIKDLCQASLDNFGNYKFKVAVDLSSVLLSESAKNNINNYQVSSSDGFIIESIAPINKNNLTKSSQRYAGSATHLISISTHILNHPGQAISISLNNNLPSWINQSSMSNDNNTNQSNFSSKTFALDQMLNGINNAYYSSGNRVFTITINLIQ